MKTLLLPIIASYYLFSIVLAGDTNSLPDFTKASPKEKLIKQTALLNSFNNYSYATDLSFAEIKVVFLKFLGKGWVEVPSYERTKKNSNKGVERHLLLSNPDFKGVHVSLLQTKGPIKGKKYLVGIKVMQKQAGKGAAPGR